MSTKVLSIIPQNIWGVWEISSAQTHSRRFLSKAKYARVFKRTSVMFCCLLPRHTKLYNKLNLWGCKLVCSYTYIQKYTYIWISDSAGSEHWQIQVHSLPGCLCSHWRGYPPPFSHWWKCWVSSTSSGSAFPSSRDRQGSCVPVSANYQDL